MKPQIILSFLKRGSLLLFYLLLFGLVIMAGNFVYKIVKNNPDNYIEIKYDNMFTNFADKNSQAHIYSKDQLIRYKAEKSLYSIEIKPNSTLGYYYILSTLLFISLGLMVLWHFHKIFAEIKLDLPFKTTVVKHLQILAFIFIIADILDFIHYFILDKLINDSIQNQQIHYLTEKGSGILTGLIILIIAVVYKRGLEIYEENSLTV